MSGQHSFICGTCGKSHAGLPTDWGFKLPDEVFVLSFLDRYRRVRSNSDLCALDEERFFIRGVLLIPFSYRDGEFAWGVWVEVAKPVHDFYLENYSNDLVHDTKVEGSLANDIPGFIELTGSKLEIEFQGSGSRPVFTLPASSEHELAVYQRQGIGEREHHAFLELCGHFDTNDS